MDSTQIKEARKMLGLTQTEFGEQIGVKLRTVQSWESGDRNISHSALIVLEDILEKYAQGTQSDNTPVHIKNKNGNKFTELPGGKFIIQVPLIPGKAFAQYLTECCDGEVMEGYAEIAFDVDHIGRGNYVAFEIKGDSMNNGGLYDNPDGATALCRELGKQHWKDGFRDSQYGWVIVHKDSILCKDIIGYDAEKGTIKCHSRNTSPEYSDFDIELNDVLQIFKIIKRTF